MKRLEIVEFLKGYSIFTIIVFHYLQVLDLPHPYNQFIFFGGTGVHLFILLSGFGLYLSYLTRPLDYICYLRKRISKIYIPYILVIVLSAFLSFFIPLYENSFYAFGGHIFLYKMFDESIMGTYGYPLWFMSMILQFYILFYALVFMARRLSNTSFLVVCTTLSLLWMTMVIVIGKGEERVWNSFFLRYLWEFALGMVMADRFVRNNYQARLKLKPAFFLIIGVLNCALYAFLAMKGGVVGKMFNDIPALIGYASIAVWFYLIRIDVINQFFVFTGKLSFPLYLLHALILHIALAFPEQVPMLGMLSVSILVTYLASAWYQKAIARLYQILKV